MVMIDINELRQAPGAVTTEEVEELINRLEASESDGLEQARLLGMSGEREAALTAKLEAAEKERDALRARIEAMQKQEPSICPAALSPVINWLRSGCDPRKAADELEMLAATPEDKP